MKVDFNSVLIDVRDGKPITAMLPVPGKFEGEGENKVPFREEKVFTLKYVAGEALGNALEEDRNQTYEQKHKRARLLEKIFKRPCGDFTVEELTAVKDRISKGYGAVVILAVENVIDPPAPAEEEAKPE